MSGVKPKKHLGQHFLTDMGIAQKITDAIEGHGGYKKMIEIGPGTGVLTQFLVKKPFDLYLIDVDIESIDYLKHHYSEYKDKIIYGDFLKTDIEPLKDENYGVIGNFPYNISSQIFFKILQNKNRVLEVVCMIQKEVADRLASPPGSKSYGILSVLLQAYYDIEYLFTVKPGVFNPPPKVNSAVIRLQRNQVESLDCDERLFTIIVKQAFQMRRKTLRNALKPINLPEQIKSLPVLDQRAEQLTVNEFVNLTNQISSWQKKG